MRFFNYTFIAMILLFGTYLFADNPQNHLNPRISTGHLDKPMTIEQAVSAQAEDESATLIGRWAKGISRAVAADDNGNVYFGNGGEFVCATINNSGKISETGRLVLPNAPCDIDLSDSGNYAYVAMGNNGVAVVDISTPSSPQLINVLSNNGEPFYAKALSLSNGRLFIAAGYQGILEATIYKADSIVFGGVYKYGGCYINDVTARNDTVFSASSNKALEMLRYTNDEFQFLNRVNYNKYTDIYENQTPFADAVVWNNDSLYVADGWSGLFFFTVDDTVITHLGHSLGANKNLTVNGKYIYSTDYQNVNAFYCSNGSPVFSEAKKVTTSQRLAVSGHHVVVSAESYGIYTFDISEPTSLVEESFYENGSKTYDVFQQKYYIYRLTPTNSLNIISVYNPSEPKEAGSIQLSSGNEEGRKVYVYGDTAVTYSYDGTNVGYKVYILDVSNPSDPQKLAEWTTDKSISDIAFKGKNLYIAEGSDLCVVDFSDLSNIHETGRVTLSGWTEDMAVQGNYVFTASEDAGMIVVDVADPANPQEKASYAKSDMDYYVKIVLQGTYAYIANSGTGLTILNIADPLNPTPAGDYTDSDDYFNADQIAVSGNYVYIHRDWGEVIFLNIANPANPILKGSYHLPGLNGLTAYSRIVNAADMSTGIYMIQNDNPDALAPCHVAGEVSGEWTCSTIYVEGDITIPAGDTLLITDKVEKVAILGPYQIKVEGVLLARGPEDGRVGLYGEDILFQGSDWKGIYFSDLNNSSVGTSIISHCRFDYGDKMDMTYQGGGAIAIYNSDNVIINNSTFYRNRARLGGAIYIEDSSPKIENCYFEVNGRGGVNLSEYYTEGGGAIYIKNSNPYLHRLRFTKNGAHSGGAMVVDGCNPKMSNILLDQNSTEGIGGAIHCVNGASPHIVNMTAADNTAPTAGGALYVNSGSNPVIINSILYGNSKPEIYLDGGTTEVSYSIVDGAGSESWFGTGCLDTDPLFDESGAIDYHLKAEMCGDGLNSPAIDAGHPDSLDTSIDCDAGLGTVRADMGYYGGRYIDMVTAIENETFESRPVYYELAQNYPNPFNPLTTIRFSLPAAGHVTLKVYNILGKEVAELIDENMNAGSKKVVFNASRFSSGVYFYKLDFNGSSLIRKMTLLK